MIKILMLFVISIYIILNFKSKKPLKTVFLYGLVLGVSSGLLNTYVANRIFNIGGRSYAMSIALYTLVFVAGYLLAERTSLPIWWSNNKSLSKIKQVVIALGVGCIIGLFLTICYRATIPGNTSVLPDSLFGNINKGSSTLLMSTLIAIQAGLTEETIYRIFLIPFIVFILSKNKKMNTKHKLIIAVIISSILHGLIPTHGFILATLISIVIGSLYLKLGFIPVVIIHAVIDVFSFMTLFSLVI